MTAINTNPHSWGYTLKKYFSTTTKLAIASIAASAVAPSGDWMFDLIRLAAVGLAISVAGYEIHQQFTSLSSSPYELLTPFFWKTLEQSNQQNQGKPLALYILPTRDDNQAYSTPESEAEILQMANRNQLAVREASKPEDLKPIIREVQKTFGPINELYLGGHGDPLFFDLGEKDYTMEEDHASIFEDLEDTEIKLMSCETGSSDEPIAKHISTETQKRVWAPVVSTDADNSVIYSRDDQKTGVLYYENSLQKYIIFDPNGTVQEPKLTRNERWAIKIAWKKKIAYLSKVAKNNPENLITLVKMHLAYEHDPEKAFRCFLKARSLGSKEKWDRLYSSAQSNCVNL